MPTDPRPTVLVVDDDKTFVHDLSVILRASGYRVYQAGGVQEAREVLGEVARIDLALVDLNLPDDSGLSLMHSVQGEKQRPRILAITAVLSDMQLEIATYLGADRAIRKFPLLSNAALDSRAWKAAVADLLPPPGASLQ